jgi:hypothetical protein
MQVFFPPAAKHFAFVYLNFARVHCFRRTRVQEIRDKHVYKTRRPTQDEVGKICNDQRWSDKAGVKKDIAAVKVWETVGSRDVAHQRASERLTEKYDTIVQKRAVYQHCLDQTWPKVQIHENVPLGLTGSGRGKIR